MNTDDDVFLDGIETDTLGGTLGPHIGNQANSLVRLQLKCGGPIRWRQNYRIR